MANIVLLPLKTNATRHGPIVSADQTVLRLKYDHEDDDGTLGWTEIEFEEVLAYRFNQWVCADVGPDTRYDEMAELDASSWLLEILNKWDRIVGWEKSQIDKGGRSRFRHYIIDFDDVGVFELICSSYQINPSLK